MTDFIVSPSSACQAENLEWDYTPPEGGFVQSGTLDVATFTAGTHYPNGYIPSGTVLAKVTATGLLAPYTTGGAGGLGTAVGVLRASVPVTRFVGGGNRTRIGVAFLVHGVVSLSKLPFQAGSGSADAAARTALPLIYWAV
jgi:hypothetical protein